MIRRGLRVTMTRRKRRFVKCLAEYERGKLARPHKWAWGVRL